MSWKFPKHPLKYNRVPDADEMNENFLAPGQELVGRLNEHNFKANTFTATNIHPKAAFVYHVNSGIRNEIPFDLVGSTGSNPGDYQAIPETANWVELSDSVLSFSSPACVVQIHAAAQLFVENVFNVATVLTQTPQQQIAIQIDGTVIPETITGGNEPAQDQYLGAFSGARTTPAVTTVTLPLRAGPHRIAIVLRNVGSRRGLGNWIGTNELICLELRA